MESDREINREIVRSVLQPAHWHLLQLKAKFRFRIKPANSIELEKSIENLEM